MKNIILIIIMLMKSYVFGNSPIELLGYDETDNSFFQKNENQVKVSAADFIQSLKKAIKSKANGNKKISSNIRKYEKAVIKSNKIKSLYEKGEVHDEGRKVKEDIYLINNPKIWYNVGGVLSAIIISPYIIEFLSFFNEDEEDEYDPLHDDEEEEKIKEKNYKKLQKFGRKTLVPGLVILSAGYIGNKIKIGQEETIIKEVDTLSPKISEYFSEIEIQNAIGIYNSVQEWKSTLV